MSANGILARLRPLATKHRIAHLAALIRREAEGSARAVELARLLRAQSSAMCAAKNGGSAE
ncbi:MAG TPA: hypothetical protein VKT76_08885 [Bradyrhizobium sp.]|nr:hypothetical protein [Bradyrhizobium sp.]